MLCIYCFLAGVAVSTGRLLWLLPLATAAGAALHWAAGAASQLALPFYKELPAERAALWRVDATHFAYSSITGGLALLFVDGLWASAVAGCGVKLLSLIGCCDHGGIASGSERMGFSHCCTCMLVHPSAC